MKLRREPGAVAGVLTVDVDVHEAAKLAVLVEAEVCDGKGLERVTERPGVDVESAAAAGLARE